VRCKRRDGKAGQIVKVEDKMDGREECRTLTECWREKKKTTEKEKEERVCQ
jgi:hypothetical protein